MVAGDPRRRLRGPKRRHGLRGVMGAVRTGSVGTEGVAARPERPAGHDILRVHALAGEPFEIRPLGRDRLDVAAPGAVGRVLRGLDFDILVNATACNLVDKAEDEVAPMIRVRREKGALRVVADQTTPTATADVARVLLRMLAEGCAPGLNHVVNDGTATWLKLAREIVRLAGVKAAQGRRHPLQGVSCPRRAPALQRARQHEGLGCVRVHAAVAGCVGALPPHQGSWNT